jgi:hypothetical protein
VDTCGLNMVIRVRIEWIVGLTYNVVA